MGVNKKMRKKIKSMALILFLILAGFGSAIMMQRLAWNIAEVEADVSAYPLVFKTSNNNISFDEELIVLDVSAGEKGIVYLSVENQIENDISGNITYEVRNNLGITGCNEISIDDLSCVNGANLLTFSDNRTFTAGTTEVIGNEIGFSNYASGLYNLTIEIL